MNSELLDFARNALAKGKSREEIKSALTQAGWRAQDIDKVLAGFAEIDFPVPVPRPRAYLSPRDVFIYLVFFFCLYVSAWNLGDLSFEFVNRTIPDPMNRVNYANGYFEAIRWNISSLIVIFPIFAWLFLLIEQRTRIDAQQRASRIRRWLTYLTLFLAALCILGDLSVLVYKLLGGELTLRILFKIAIVGVLAGGIFSFFLSDMRKTEQEEGV